MKKPSKFRMQALDMWAATHCEKVDKPALATFNTAQRVNPERLKHAVSQTFGILPEILSYYDPKQCVLQRVDFAIDDIVRVYETEPDDSAEYWDVNVFTGPLLKVHLFHSGEGSHLRFCLSHIICDGGGLKQYLELVCRFYNNPALSAEDFPRNVRMSIYRLSKRLRTIKCYKLPELEEYIPDIGKINLPFADNSNARYKALTTYIEAGDMARVREKVKKNGATMNDLFLTAFLRALSCHAGQERCVIHCPLDLRGLLVNELKGKLTICNLTSKYICPAEILPEDTFDKTLSGIREKMNMQKERMPEYAIRGVKQMFRWEWLLTDKLIAWVMRDRYEFHSIYYTNCGVMDENAISFCDSEITSVSLMGGFLSLPAYQFSITTYKGRAALVCNVNGSPANILLAEEILMEVKNRIMRWIGMSECG